MNPGPLFTEDEIHAWAPFVIGVLHLLSTLDAELKASFDLSHLDYGILMLLSQTPEHFQRMSVFATTFGVDPSNITYRVRRMESRGLVERSTRSSDGRVVDVHITDKGLVLLRKAQLVHVQGARRHFLEHLEPEQLHAIAVIFGNLRAIQLPSQENAYMESTLPDTNDVHEEHYLD
ncbi:MAG: MarR family transcriptional regulator [Ktedonobacteraceae bacterium]